MRVLAVTNIYPTSHSPASGTFVEQQVEGLRRRGVDVEVLLIDRARKGVRVYFEIERRLAAAVETHRPDLVHVMYGGVMARSVSRCSKNLPLIVSFCGSDLLGENLPGIRQWMVKCGVKASHEAARKAHGIVVKSKNLLAALPSDVNHDKVRVIANGIDLQRFKPVIRQECRDKLGWRSDRFHVLFPANNGTPRKRPALARMAVEELNRIGIEADFHSLREIPHADVPLWINASDAVLLTSLHEGSPNIVKEALACNVPIVSVDVGDVAERIDGIEGCYLASSDPFELATKLLLVSRGQRRVKGRERIQQLSLEAVAKRIIDFYQEVVSNYGLHHVV